VMAAVVDFHGGLIDRGFQGVRGIGKGGQLERHGFAPLKSPTVRQVTPAKRKRWEKTGC